MVRSGECRSLERDNALLGLVVANTGREAELLLSEYIERCVIFASKKTTLQERHERGIPDSVSAGALDLDLIYKPWWVERRISEALAE